MESPVFPAVAQPPMRQEHVGPGSQPYEGVNAIIDNRSDLPDGIVAQAIEDRWVEIAGLQFAQPSNFTLYSTTSQGSMLARTPFRTPSNVIQEVELARTVADSDDDVAAALGLMNTIAFGKGVMNQHKDEGTLEFFNQMTSPKTMDVESVLSEMYREFLIAGSVTTLSLFMRQRMKYYPMKSVEPVLAQLQVPRVGILPAENLRVITNDIIGQGQLAYFVQDYYLKNWLEEYFNTGTSNLRKSMMAQEEPVASILFTGRIQMPYNDGDPTSRGLILYTLNQNMIHRTTMAKGAMPYPRPLLTRNFPLLEAKRLLNLMDYSLLQGGTNYIVVAKKGDKDLPAQPGEVANLQNQIARASRSGVLVGDHRLQIEIVAPNLEQMLNPAKRQLLGRKLSMALLRQTEPVTSDGGTVGAENEMSLLARVVDADRRKMIRHAESTFYDETAERNRSTFKMGAPTIWGPPIILTGVKDFWANLVQASDRGLIPHRYVVEALGFDYEASLAEREREIARGDTESLVPAKVPFSSPGVNVNVGPQDNGPGRPVGTSSNNGRGKDTPGQGKDPHAPNHVIRRTAGETIKAIVENNEVHLIGETTRVLLEQYENQMEMGYVTATEREAIDVNQVIRSGSSVIVPVNNALACVAYRTVKLEDGLRVVIGQRRADDALVAKALRFSEPHFDLLKASEYALRWGFISEPLLEVAGKKRCVGCGNEMPDYNPQTNCVCPTCGCDNTGMGPVEGGSSETGVLTKLLEAAETRERSLTDILRDVTLKPLPAPGDESLALAELTARLQDVIFGREEEQYGRAFTMDQRRQLAKEGKAKPDLSFPIENEEDLKSAIDLARSDSDRAWVKKRAAALGKSSMIPDTW